MNTKSFTGNNHLNAISGNSINNNNNGITPTLKQMEDNKRKYLVKQQQQLLTNRTPTLSAQKVNQIKAKLGLTIINNNGSSHNSKDKNQSPLAASTNSISISSLDNNNNQIEQATSGILTSINSDSSINNSDNKPSADDTVGYGANKLLIGAPLNSIPKTDFECADKRGKFVSGLFADHKTGCQVWHLCSNNRKYSFLCPSGTIFNEKVRICDWRYNVKCEKNSLML